MVFFFLVPYSKVAALYEENKPIYFVLSHSTSNSQQGGTPSSLL